MADVEKININSTDYDIADAKALRNKDNVGSGTFVDSRAGTTAYPTPGTNLVNSTIIGNKAYINNNTVLYNITVAGANAYAGYSYVTVVGNNSYALSAYSLACGCSAKANGSATGSVVLGSYATSDNAYNTVVGYGAIASAAGNVVVGANALANAGSNNVTICGRNSNADGGCSSSSVLGANASVTQSQAVQLGQGTNNNYGSLQFRTWPLVNGDGRIYEERLPSTVRFTTDEPTVLEWQDDEELRKLVFMYTGEDNDLFKHGLCYQAKAKQGHPKFWCGWTGTDYIPRNECVRVDNEKLFLKLAEISKARYEDEGNWENSLIGGDNAEQTFYFYYNVNDAQWRIEINNDSFERGFRGTPDSYYFEQGETLEDFGIYVKDLTLPTEAGYDEEMFDIYSYAPVYCDGYDFGNDIDSVDYMQMMTTMCDPDYGFGWVIDNMESWEYEVDGTTYTMPVIPEIYISAQDDEEYNNVAVRWEWNGTKWSQYINGSYCGYGWTTAEMYTTFGIKIESGEESSIEYIEFYFCGAKQLYWEQFNPIDETEFATASAFSNLQSVLNFDEENKMFKQVQAARDLDDMTTAGQYRIEAIGCSNLPTQASGSRFFWLFVTNYANNGTEVRQVLIADKVSMTAGAGDYCRYAPNIFVRCRYNNTWSSWKPLLTDEASPWIQGFDRSKKQMLVHNTNNNTMVWEDVE